MPLKRRPYPWGYMGIVGNVWVEMMAIFPVVGRPYPWGYMGIVGNTSLTM